jgi:hypothetical protein
LYLSFSIVSVIMTTFTWFIRPNDERTDWKTSEESDGSASAFEFLTSVM